MNAAALSIPPDRLVAELALRRERRLAANAERDARWGRDRVAVTSYLENIGWTDLFGHAMRRVHDDPEFAAAQVLREAIFWADNVDDDTVPAATIQADTGWYWDMTLFGMKIRHTRIGVPEFQPHPLRERLDPALLPPFDFAATGDLPRVVERHARLRELSAERFGGALAVTFPSFHRGPLDVLVQLRGYENFVEDTVERPAALREVLDHIVAERLRFARERARHLGEAPPATTFVADDWVNVPFVPPALFRDLVLPLYRRIRAEEGPVTGFHTCGNIEAVAGDLVGVFPEMATLDVSPWNAVAALDASLPPRIGFSCAVLNTVTLGTSEEEQRRKLDAIRDAARHRKVAVVAQAIERVPETWQETFARLNRFLGLARSVLCDGGR